MEFDPTKALDRSYFSSNLKGKNPNERFVTECKCIAYSSFHTRMFILYEICVCEYEPVLGRGDCLLNFWAGS